MITIVLQGKKNKTWEMEGTIDHVFAFLVESFKGLGAIILRVDKASKIIVTIN